MVRRNFFTKKYCASIVFMLYYKYREPDFKVGSGRLVWLVT